MSWFDDGDAAGAVELGSVEDVRRERLRWLGNLRWLAMFSAVCCALIAVFLDWEFVKLEAIAGGVVLGVLGNLYLLVRTRRQSAVGPSELSWHAVLDSLLLTFFLAFSGGLENPVSSSYSIHVVLGALLVGRRGMMSAAWTSSIGIFVLFLLETTNNLPTRLEHAPPLLNLGALGILLLGLSYFSYILASRLRSEETLARQKRQEAERNLHLLNDSLNALDVGIVVSRGEELLLKNAYARNLEDDLDAFHVEEDGKRLVAEGEEGTQRIVDKVDVLGVGDDDTGLSAVLYVDRTEELLVAQRHVMLERLATLGRALQGVAHELNTPLTTMQMLAKDLHGVLSTSDVPDEVRDDCLESVDIIVDETRRCRSLTQGLLQTARSPREPHLGETAAFVAQRAVRLVGGNKGQVELDVDSLDFVLDVDADRVLQVLMNLIQNSMKASEDHHQSQRRDGQAPAVKVYARDGADGKELVVDDQGGGLPLEVQDRLFEPFVTTKAMGEGTGLGLYTSLITAHDIGAELQLQSDNGRGTTAVLTLPRA